MARVRITDVAAVAGVSTATVSLVLNGNDARITTATAERVRRAAAEVGYTPNGVARGLRTQRTRTIGLVSDQIATTPFAGRMLAGAQDVAREHDHLVVLVDTGGDPGVERDAVRALADHQVDNLVYACMWHRVVEPVEGLPPTAVYLDCRPTTGRAPAVVPDDHGGGVAAVTALVEAGHRRIAYVDVDETGPDRPIAANLRRDAWREVLAATGVEPDPAWHVHGASDAAGGRAATHALLDLPQGRRPTAVFCFNDRMAVGVYQAAAAHGLTIPDDLSVVGYDDQQLVATELLPPLTTVALPHEAMGRWAMEVALGTRTPDPGGAHLMPCVLVRRASVGPPPAAAANSSRRRV